MDTEETATLNFHQDNAYIFKASIELQFDAEEPDYVNVFSFDERFVTLLTRLNLHSFVNVYCKLNLQRKKTFYNSFLSAFKNTIFRIVANMYEYKKNIKDNRKIIIEHFLNVYNKNIIFTANNCAIYFIS